MRTILFLSMLVFVATTSGCAIFGAAGDSVEAVGEGAGHAVGETGRAITRAADEIDADL